MTTPTTYHKCPKTTLDAAVRATSNLVRPDKEVFSEYQDYMRAIFIPELLDKVRNFGEVYVDFHKWLDGNARYTQVYKEKMRKAIDPRNIEPGQAISMVYEAFLKVELQFSEVPHELKHTAANTAKTRQISGPQDRKKASVNAYVSTLEYIFHCIYPEYCGRKNWMDICKDLEEMTSTIPDATWAAADGSGFDMTQLPEHNEMMNELFIKILNLPNVLLGPEFSKEDIIDVLKRSLYLDVSCDRGKLRYSALGRASGDGWTTCGNTILMLSYWRFCLWKAGVPVRNFGLRAKGDDVLLALSLKYKAAVIAMSKKLFTTTKDLQCFGLGQICKKIDWGDITEVDFLSCHFFYTAKGKLRMTRIPSRVIQSISYSSKFRMKDNPDVAKQLCYSKGACLKAWATGLPIFGVLADKMIELGRNGPITDYEHYKDWGRIWLPKDDYQSYLVYLNNRYGLSKKQVNEIETAIKKLDNKTLHVDIPALAMFFV
jgi:hypothetical protein